MLFDGLHYPRLAPPNQLPGDPMTLERDHPFADGLVFCAPLRCDTLDYSFFSPMGNAGTAVGQLVGPMGACSSFTTSGSTSNIDFGQPQHLDLAIAGSWSFWIYPTGGGATYRVFERWGPIQANQQFSFAMLNPQIIQFTVSNSSGTYRTVKTTASLTLNAWTHVVVTWQASGQVTAVYFNGVAQTLSTVTAGSPTALQHVTSNLSVGYGLNSGGTGFPGNLSTLLIWRNRVLSAAEVMMLYVEPFTLLREDMLLPLISPYTAPPASTGGPMISLIM